METKPTDRASPSPFGCSAFALCNLMLLLPYLHVTTTNQIDYASADPALLIQLADAADTVLLITHIGTSAISGLLARAGVDPLGSETVADSVEALGWLVAELNDMAGAVRRISAACRRHTYDYAPGGVTAIRPARP